MCCLALLTLGLGPRIAFAAWWIFGDKVDIAYDTWIWPLLGLLFLPWTALFYTIAWSAPGGVNGAEWLIVGIGVALDIMTYSSRAAQSRYDASRTSY